MLHITDPKFKKTGILKLPDLFDYQSLLFIYDYMTKQLPRSFDGVFVTNMEIPNARNTRQSRHLYVPRITSRFAQKLPIYYLPNLWNKWIEMFTDNLSKYQMKRFIRKTMLQGYAEQVYCDNIRCVECYPP